jgi:small subunit ribosomal protein S5e
MAYLNVKTQKAQVFLPFTAGRYQKRSFQKVNCPIVERLGNSLMMKGRNNGKKQLSLRVVKQALEIIHLLTGENPL